MKKFLIIMSFVFFASLLCMKAQWHLLNGPGKTRIMAIGYDDNNWYAVLGSGLFRSTNEGNDWEYFNTMGSLDYQTEQCIFNVGDTIFIGSKKGVYYSTNTGQSWELIADGLIINQYYTSHNIIALERNNEHIFALTSERLYTFDNVNKKFSNIEIGSPGLKRSIYVSNNLIIVGSYSQTFLPHREPNIFISKDNGITWKSITDSISRIDELNINCFTMINDTIYAGTQNGIFRSIDEGNHWELLENGLSGYEITNILVTHDGVYAGTKKGLFYTSEIGKYWEKKDHGLTNNEVVSMSYINGKILVGTEHGLFYTTDKGDNWISINEGLGGGSMSDIKENANKLYANPWDDGLFSSADSGKTWQLVVDKSLLIPWNVLAVDNKRIYFASRLVWNMFYSLDYGVSWKKVPDTTAVSGKRVLDLLIIKHNIIACTNKGIFISKDSAKSWYSISPVLEPYGFNFIHFYNNYIFAGTTGSKSYGLFKSTNNGVDWVHDSTDFGGDNILTDILKTEKGFFIASSGGGVFKSTDNGMTWDSVNNGLSNKSVISLVEFNNNIFASTKNGIFLSTNSGGEWKEVSNGLTIKYIYKLLIYGDYIYADSPEGIFRANLSDFGITDVLENQIESRNYLYSYPPYPTPSKNVVNTLIYWDTSIDIDKIDIIDNFGNKIGDKKDITINKQSPYNGILTWDCSGVPNGIYFILINHGTEKRAIKILINK